ncbi:MAG: FAD-dependent oxidoreductase, partial [Planctomycetota bacterium]
MKKIIPILLFIMLFCVPCTHATQASIVNESARDIPVAYDVDVVVVGGSSGGVAAAVEAARKGEKVFLAAQRPYLGEDICATYRLWLEPGEVPGSP